MTKQIYPPEVQRKILQEAKNITMSRYGNDPSVLAVYLGGSATQGKLGVYDKPIYFPGFVEKSGSDIDVMLVIEDRHDWLPLSKSDQKKYGLRHIAPQIVSLYRMTDTNGNDILLNGIHPIESLVMTKDSFDGTLTAIYQWGRIPRQFSEDVKGFDIWKESPDVRSIREKHC